MGVGRRVYWAADRARWGAGGALNPQPALAGLNSLSRSGVSGLAAIRDVDGRVPRGGERRTRSGPEGSSRKPTSLGDEGTARPELTTVVKPEWRDRQGVHGLFTDASLVTERGVLLVIREGLLARARSVRQGPLLAGASSLGARPVQHRYDQAIAARASECENLTEGRLRLTGKALA